MRRTGPARIGLLLAGLLAVGGLTLGCNDGSGTTPDDTGNGIPDPDGTGQDCSEDHSPEFELEAVAGDPDWYETDSGVKCLPTVVIRAVDVTDPDGDLTYYKMDVWFDSVVDGRVLREGAKPRIENRVEGDDCEVDSLPGVGMNLGIAGGGTNSPAFDTETEFGVVLQDDAGNESYDGEPKVISVVTPGPVASDSECPDR